MVPNVKLTQDPALPDRVRGALSRESDGHVGDVDERASVVELDRVVPLAPPNHGAVARRGAVNRAKTPWTALDGFSGGTTQLPCVSR
jgi:hypothetical protein